MDILAKERKVKELEKQIESLGDSETVKKLKEKLKDIKKLR